MFSAAFRALLCFGLRGCLLGSTPKKNEVSGQFCLPVRSDLCLFVDVGDFAAVLRETNWFDCRSDNTGTIRTIHGTRLVQSVAVCAQLVSQLLTATELVPQSFLQAEKGKSVYAGCSGQRSAGWGTHPVASRVSAERFTH